MNTHTLTLFGGGSDERLRVSATVFNETLRLFLDAVRMAVRFEIEGESVRRGQRPGWLDKLCDLELTGLTAGSAVIEIDAPTFSEATENLVWGDEHSFGDHSAVDRFAIVLASMTEGAANDGVFADRALLDVCARLIRAPGTCFDGLKLDGLRARTKPVVVRSTDAIRIEALIQSTPPSQAIRLFGKLDTISASRASIILILEDGTRLPARLDQHDPETLGHLFGNNVTVSGMMHYRPSGQPLHIRVESINRARESDLLFKTLPRTAQLPFVEPLSQDESSGVNAFFGNWPGEETEDELLLALKECK